MVDVSIILPVYNSAHYLSRTLTSILQQTMTNFEVIAIDDGSKDNSLEILYAWASKDERLKIIQNDQNIGVAKTRNKGIALANGKYICFVDSDDTWRNNKLEEQLLFMRRTDCDFCCTAYAMMDDDGKFIKNRMISKQQILLDDLLKENYICCSTVMLKSDIAKQHKMNDDFAHEDYVYWLDLLQNGAKGMALNQNLVWYRLAQAGRSANKGKAAQGRWWIYRKYLKMSFVKSAWYFGHYAINGLKKYFRCYGDSPKLNEEV